jgi:DMSO reductase family type II enzyme heme b subunit
MKALAKTILTFSVPLVLLGVLYFALMYRMTRDRVVGVTPEKPLVMRYTQHALPIDPLDEYWSSIDSSVIHLWPQNARVPYGTEERDVVVRGAYNELEVAFLLRFADSTESREVAPTGTDACAVFIGPGDSPAVAQMMGQDGSGNIWHWLADRDAEQYQGGDDSVQAALELVTTGPGTQTPLEHQTVVGRGEYRAGYWHVVLKRTLSSQQDDAIELSAGSDLIVSFAVWDGAKLEAFAAKSIAILRPLILDGG